MSSTETQGTAPVVDRRPIPRGVLPKGFQTWLMVALAVGIVLIIFLTGQPQAPERAQAAAAPLQQVVNPDRVRDYQERLRALNEPMNADIRPAMVQPQTMPPAFQDDAAPERVDPLADERKRREYESLFASNVVVSHRATLQKQASNHRTTAGDPNDISQEAPGAEPSLDAIAEAVVRASTRSELPMTGANGNSTARSEAERVAPPRPEIADAATRPAYRLLEGTVIDTVLTNRLDGSEASPVNCLVTNAVYATNSRRMLIPAGARILGQTRQVEGLGDTRLAVAFHRVAMPDGTSIALDRFKGLNQIGDSGLRDRVNQHYWSTFGAAAAVGLVGGLGQVLSGAALGGGDGDRTIVIAGGSADAASQASAQTLGRFLNRMPTITIREGHRVKVYVTSDVELPEWNPSSAALTQR